MKLFIAQALVLAGIAVVHIAALQWYLYWHFVWLDVPVHFAGGVWLALMGSWILLRAGQEMRVETVFSIVVVLSIAWEIFELAAGIPREANFLFDTVLDLTMDMAGAILGFLLARALAGRGTISLNEEVQSSAS